MRTSDDFHSNSAFTFKMQNFATLFFQIISFGVKREWFKWKIVYQILIQSYFLVLPTDKWSFLISKD